MKKCPSTEFIRELDIYLVKLQRILLENSLFILTLNPTQVQNPVEKINNLKMDERDKLRRMVVTWWCSAPASRQTGQSDPNMQRPAPNTLRQWST